MLLAPLLLSALLGTSAPTPQLSRACVRLSRTPLVSQPPLPSHQDRRSFLVRGAAVASSMLALSSCAEDEKMLWISGKSDPIRKTSKDKPDGTKKDPKFLGCLNDCIPRCQGPPTAGVQKERAECLEQCQAECCFTYQQCTATLRQ